MCVAEDMGILEKIAEIEREISRTQKNKGGPRIVTDPLQHGSWSYVRFLAFAATEYHLGLLKAKLARYRSQLLEPKSTGSSKVLCRAVLVLVGKGWPVLGKGRHCCKLQIIHSYVLLTLQPNATLTLGVPSRERALM